MTTIPLLVRMIVALAAVLGLIFGSVWLLRRYAPGRFSRTAPLPIPLQLVGRTWLGQRREICAVRVSDRLLLLGVTPVQINLLSELAHAFPGEEEAEAARPTPGPAEEPRPALGGRPAAGRSPIHRGERSRFGAELNALLGGLSRHEARLRGEEL